MDSHEVGELRRVAEQVAAEAADLVRRRRREHVVVTESKTSITDVVTEVDEAAEALVRDRLAAVRPGDGFFGEEGGRSGSQSGLTWVVDPIDGTVNYLYDLGRCCVSVAAVDAHEQPVAGAVVDVSTGTVFSAGRGAGATEDGTALRVREPVPMGERLVLTGFAYEQRIRSLQGQAVARLLPQVRDIRRMGSAALDLCTIASGRADAYVEEGLHLWDRAAAGLVATEAGARLVVARGVGGMDCVVCAPEATFDEVFDLVVSCGFVAAEATSDGA